MGKCIGSTLALQGPYWSVYSWRVFQLCKYQESRGRSHKVGVKCKWCEVYINYVKHLGQCLVEQELVTTISIVFIVVAVIPSP